MKLTVKEALSRMSTANSLKGKSGKFDYALKKMNNRIQDALGVFDEKVEDARVEFCSVDERGHILRSEKGEYVFTKENYKDFVKKVKMLELEEIEFEPYIASELPEDIDEYDKEQLSGILI